MGKKHSVTRATQSLKKAGVPFQEHPYDYLDHGGASESARQLGVDQHLVVKTLVMQDEARRPLLILMHGDYTVSTKNLAREIGCKSVEACVPADAERYSGYQVGGKTGTAEKKSPKSPIFQSISSVSS